MPSYTTDLTPFGFVLVDEHGRTVFEVPELPEELRPNLTYSKTAPAYHWSAAFRARRAADYLNGGSNV